MSTCIKCRHENPDNYDHCSNCGHELDSNFCTNESCQTHNGGDNPLEEDECFCSVCGSPTVYFEEGLIKPYVHPEDE